MKSQGVLRGGSESLQEEERERIREFNLKRLKWVVVDPRLSASASNADQWIPIKPGQDAALALGMIRWILTAQRFDRRYLENTGRRAALEDGEPTWTDSTYLVRLDTMAFLRAGDIGLEGDADDYVVSVAGVPTRYSRVRHADLESELTVDGIRCKTVFSLLKEEVMAKSIEEYARLAGVRPRVIEGLAREFVSYGKKAVADFYNGVTKHTNGLYTARAVITLNLLIGNIDWKGGLVKGGGSWDYLGTREDARYKLTEIEGAPQPAGIKINRAGERYEDSSEYKKKGYPAKRPWFPLAQHGNYQEILASISQGYPYPIKALMLYYANPAYSVPGAAELASRVLKDRGKIPLLIAIDVEMSESAALADYILPDTVYLEKWFVAPVSAAITSKTVGVGQPVSGELNPSTGEYKPINPDTRMVEDILIHIAKKLDLPGFGEKAFPDGGPLHRAWDYYRRLIANVAYDSSDGGPVPGATEKEKVQYVLSRGGRFEDYGKDLNRRKVPHMYNNICHIYSETLATTRDSVTGETHAGLPKYQPISDVAGRVIEDKDYPFHLVTHKYIFHSLSRTVVNRWLMEVLPDNFVILNPADLRRLGLKKGDSVALRSRSFTGEIYGRIFPMEGVKPGVLVIPHSFGHWEMGSRPRMIDGKKTAYDETRKTGVAAANAVMRLDPLLQDVSLQDKLGGCASLFDTKVSITRA
jgi:anaerobic selenocysteine-containing dehydrogenase